VNFRHRADRYAADLDHAIVGAIPIAHRRANRHGIRETVAE
jgi:hypothetical protein